MTNTQVKICWLTGCYFRRTESIKKICDGIKGYELYVYDNDVSAEYIEQQIMNHSLFVDKRIFILNSLPQYGNSSQVSNKKWSEIFKNTPNDCVIILNNIDPVKHEKLYKYVSSIGKVINYNQFLVKADAINWIISGTESIGKTILNDDAELIVDMIGEEYKKGVDLEKLYISFYKVRNYVGTHKKITREDIVKVADKYNNFIIWDLFNAIDDKNCIKCISLAKDYYNDNKNVKESIQYIFNMLLWRFRLFLTLKEIKSYNSRLSENDIIEKMNTLYKIKRKGFGFYTSYTLDLDKEEKPKPMYTSFVVSSAMKSFYGNPSSLDKYDRKILFLAVKSIEESLLKIRNSNTEIDSILMLNLFFMLMCGIFQDNILSKIRRFEND